jgi:hypothetical protein
MTAEQSTFNKYSRPNISCLQNTAPHLLPKTKKNQPTYNVLPTEFRILWLSEVHQPSIQVPRKAGMGSSSFKSYLWVCCNKLFKTDQNPIQIANGPVPRQVLKNVHIEFHPRCGGGGHHSEWPKYFPPIITKLTRLVDIGLIRMYKVWKKKWPEVDFFLP